MANTHTTKFVQHFRNLTIDTTGNLLSKWKISGNSIFSQLKDGEIIIGTYTPYSGASTNKSMLGIVRNYEDTPGHRQEFIQAIRPLSDITDWTKYSDPSTSSSDKSLKLLMGINENKSTGEISVDRRGIRILSKQGPLDPNAETLSYTIHKYTFDFNNTDKTYDLILNANNLYLTDYRSSLDITGEGAITGQSSISDAIDILEKRISDNTTGVYIYNDANKILTTSTDNHKNELRIYKKHIQLGIEGRPINNDSTADLSDYTYKLAPITVSIVEKVSGTDKAKYFQIESTPKIVTNTTKFTSATRPEDGNGIYYINQGEYKTNELRLITNKALYDYLPIHAVDIKEPSDYSTTSPSTALNNNELISSFKITETSGSDYKSHYKTLTPEYTKLISGNGISITTVVDENGQRKITIKSNAGTSGDIISATLNTIIGTAPITITKILSTEDNQLTTGIKVGFNYDATDFKITTDSNNTSNKYFDLIDYTEGTAIDINNKQIAVKIAEAINSNENLISEQPNGVHGGLYANVKLVKGRSRLSAAQNFRLVNTTTGHQLGDTITIESGSSLIAVQLGHIDDTLPSTTSISYDDNGNVVVNEGSGSESLNFIYQTKNITGVGYTYKLTAVNLETFLQEAEFKNGLEVSTTSHEVSVKLSDVSNKDFGAIQFGTVTGREVNRPIGVKVNKETGLYIDKYDTANSDTNKGRINIKLNGALYNATTSSTDGIKPISIRTDSKQSGLQPIQHPAADQCSNSITEATYQSGNDRITVLEVGTIDCGTY